MTTNFYGNQYMGLVSSLAGTQHNKKSNGTKVETRKDIDGAVVA